MSVLMETFLSVDSGIRLRYEYEKFSSLFLRGEVLDLFGFQLQLFIARKFSI